MVTRLVAGFINFSRAFSLVNGRFTLLNFNYSFVAISKMKEKLAQLPPLKKLLVARRLTTCKVIEYSMTLNYLAVSATSESTEYFLEKLFLAQ